MAPRLELDRRTLRLMAIAFVLLAGLTIHRLWLAPTPDALEVLEVSGETMGTTYHLRIAGSGLDDRLRARVEQETARRLDDVDRWMSNWNPDSEIVRFNAHRSTEGFRVSSPTAEVVAYAIELGKWSGGAFDVTIRPLVALWGFGQGARIGEAPTQAEIDAHLRHTGARLLRVGRGNPRDGGFLRKEDPEVEIDLSAIAKGFGVDHVAEGLASLGRTDFLVEIGGEVRAVGERPGGGPWRVAIEKPLDDGRAIQTVVELSDRAMATSGDYRIFYREDGRRIAHTIDPRTGRPVENGPASATVIAGTATEADAWATVLMVLGEKEGFALADAWGIAAMLLLRDESGGIVERRNALFPEAIAAPNAEIASE
ncbi:MAG TPA: FAD:protein FMN transferase [Myxococcota bacterium]|nr:FAD:protein FMN transferase [Myxococcales bacterium]HPG27314.1 FAD:protein FMN transferase [Myxococcota bacterium]